ncbi:MAG: hypothetical protein JWQ30_1843 [Sediminibacterium sp.]|nr:hypothetical protein [Sediminibacterium sp.]
MTLTKFIIVLSHIPIFITALYAAFLYRSLGKALKRFSLFLFLSGIIQGISLAFWFLNKNNFPLLHIYIAIGFCILAWFYKTVLKGFINPKIINITIVIFLLFTLVNSLFFQTIFTFNSYALVLECILIIILSLSTYIFFINDIAMESRIENITSINWINSGLFIYNTSSLVIFYFGDYFTRHFPEYINRYTWVLHSFFSMVMYTFFYIGLWKRRRR